MKPEEHSTPNAGLTEIDCALKLAKLARFLAKTALILKAKPEQNLAATDLVTAALFLVSEDPEVAATINEADQEFRLHILRLANAALQRHKPE